MAVPALAAHLNHLKTQMPTLHARPLKPASPKGERGGSHLSLRSPPRGFQGAARGKPPKPRKRPPQQLWQHTASWQVASQMFSLLRTSVLSSRYSPQPPSSETAGILVKNTDFWVLTLKILNFRWWGQMNFMYSKGLF